MIHGDGTPSTLRVPLPRAADGLRSAVLADAGDRDHEIPRRIILAEHGINSGTSARLKGRLRVGWQQAHVEVGARDKNIDGALLVVTADCVSPAAADVVAARVVGVAGSADSFPHGGEHTPLTFSSIATRHPKAGHLSRATSAPVASSGSTRVVPGGNTTSDPGDECDCEECRR